MAEASPKRKRLWPRVLLQVLLAVVTFGLIALIILPALLMPRR